ncbi:hypothetical protein [Gorillibacterium sp. CAU 1737]|uniref:hypothetical protein n=1 Tax=Gorillibacterium sp. CAU 1737 TaxID=3140362 RepID=UPI00326093AF
MEQWSAFLADRWYVILIVLVALFLVIRIVKTFVKWVLVLVIAAGVLYYGYNYEGSLDKIKQAVTTVATESLQQQATDLMKKEAQSAKYVKNKNGSYTITTTSLKLTGKPGDEEVKVTVLKQTFTMKASTVKAFVEEAAKNGN